MTELLTDGPAAARNHLLLAHGAGVAMQSPFMEAMASLLAARGVAVTRFEFRYMAERRANGKRRPPPKAETLQQEFLDAVALARARLAPGCRLLVGGKSMGGRVASLVADQLRSDGLIAGLVVLGYPFHPPNKPDQLRTRHLEQLRCPALIAQGERDPFGSRSEVEGYALSSAIGFHWARDGDHDLGPRGGQGLTRKGNLDAAADAIVTFVSALG